MPDEVETKHFRHWSEIDKNANIEVIYKWYDYACIYNVANIFCKFGSELN